MRSSWIGFSLLELSSLTRAAHPSRRTAAFTAVRTTSQTSNNKMSENNEDLPSGEVRTDLSGSVTVEVTL